MKGECGCLGELKSCVLGVTENEDKKLHASHWPEAQSVGTLRKGNCLMVRQSKRAVQPVGKQTWLTSRSQCRAFTHLTVFLNGILTVNSPWTQAWTHMLPLLQAMNRIYWRDRWFPQLPSTTVNAKSIHFPGSPSILGGVPCHVLGTEVLPK